MKTFLKQIIAAISHEGLKTQLRKSFFTGLLVVVPISVTVYILVFLIKVLNRFLPFNFLPYGTGIVLTIIHRFGPEQTR